MKVEQRLWEGAAGWRLLKEEKLAAAAQLVLVFGDYEVMRDVQAYAALKEVYPRAAILGCSACGSIFGSEINEDSFVATALFLERTTVRIESVEIAGAQDSFQAGEMLAKRLTEEGLNHVFVLCDGLNTDGDALTHGLTDALPAGVMVTGGLAGDLEKFEQTSVLANAESASFLVAAVGFYGEDLCVGHGCFGGWDSFGQDRLVTRSEGNVLYEIDGKSALELYKRYLGEFADGLPATALYFPLNLKLEKSASHLVRSVLSIDEEKGALIFGGAIPQGSTVTLMKANVNRLVDGALKSGQMSVEQLEPYTADLAVLVSCAARKMVLKQRTEEETEAVQDALQDVGCMTGFYSFGEICPVPGKEQTACEFHNQTMTITTFFEKGG